MKLIVISSSATLENEADTITRLFEAGLETFHLRKHKLSTRKTKELIRLIPAHFHNRIVLHSHHMLARKFNLKGIHLTKTHKKRKVRTLFRIWILRLRRPALIITTSFSSIGDLLEPHPFQYDYAFLSPIFDSLNSKFQGGFTEHSLRSAMGKTKMGVIARGGVDIEAIAKAEDLKFGGLAFYTSLWGSKDPVMEFNKIIRRFEELKIKIE
jgi:thiamine-phosphate pyrophosphorylase